MIIHFTIEAAFNRRPSGRQGIRTLIPTSGNRFSRAARPTVSGYLPICQWTHRESNPDSQTASLVSVPLDHEPVACSVDRRGVEPRSPGCKPGVFPLDQQPVVGSQRSVRELNPAFLLTKEACGRNTYRPVVQHRSRMELEPSLSWMSPRRLDRWTTGSASSDRGGSRTHKITRLSDLAAFGLRTALPFAYPAVSCRSGCRTRRSGL